MTENLEVLQETITKQLEVAKAHKALAESNIEECNKSEHINKPSVQYQLHQLEESLEAFDKAIAVMEREVSTNEERREVAREVITIYANVAGVIPEGHQEMSDEEFESVRGGLFKEGYIKGVRYGWNEGMRVGIDKGMMKGLTIDNEQFARFLRAAIKEGKLEIRDGDVKVDLTDAAVQKIYKKSLKGEE